MKSHQLPMTEYEVPQSPANNISYVMIRSYYICHIGSPNQEGMCTMMTNAPEDVVPRIIERAKMGKLGKNPHLFCLSQGGSGSSVAERHGTDLLEGSDHRCA